MTENFQDKLHQVDCKQSKVAKISGVIRRELECEKRSKTFCQIYAIQNMQNQTNAKHFIDSEDVFKSTKNVLEKRSTSEDPSNITTSKVLSKIWNRKNLHSNNTTFPWLRVLLKFMVHSVELNSSEFLNLKHFNLLHLNKIDIDMNLNTQIQSLCSLFFYIL